MNDGESMSSKSNDEKVQNFLDEVLIFDEDKHTYLMELRGLILNLFPKAEERMMYGGILFSLHSEDFCGLFVRKNHISLEFSNGTGMKDPKRLLEGTGQFRRHLKFKSAMDIKNKDAAYFLKQAI